MSWSPRQTGRELPESPTPTPGRAGLPQFIGKSVSSHPLHLSLLNHQDSPERALSFSPLTGMPTGDARSLPEATQLLHPETRDPEGQRAAHPTPTCLPWLDEEQGSLTRGEGTSGLA